MTLFSPHPLHFLLQGYEFAIRPSNPPQDLLADLEKNVVIFNKNLERRMLLVRSLFYATFDYTLVEKKRISLRHDDVLKHDPAKATVEDTLYFPGAFSWHLEFEKKSKLEKGKNTFEYEVEESGTIKFKALEEIGDDVVPTDPEKFRFKYQLLDVKSDIRVDISVIPEYPAQSDPKMSDHCFDNLQQNEELFRMLQKGLTSGNSEEQKWAGYIFCNLFRHPSHKKFVKDFGNEWVKELFDSKVVSVQFFAMQCLFHRSDSKNMVIDEDTIREIKELELEDHFVSNVATFIAL